MELFPSNEIRFVSGLSFSIPLGLKLRASLIVL
jgi:hypothetical protein